MQPGLITKQDTAAILGKACRTVEWYANKGFLSRYKQGRRVYYSAEEVRRLQRELEKEGTTNPEMAALRCRVQKLELDVSLLLRILDARRRVDLSVEELEELRRRADTETSWSLSQVEAWHAVLMSLEDEDYTRLPTGAWRSFDRLATMILRSLQQNPAWDTSLEMQRLTALMRQARGKMRGVLLACDELGRDYKQLFGESPDVKAELFALL